MAVMVRRMAVTVRRTAYGATDGVTAADDVTAADGVAATGGVTA
jgi:hypothetical protein